jgi:hypothetical protein
VATIGKAVRLEIFHRKIGRSEGESLGVALPPAGQRLDARRRRGEPSNLLIF